MTELLRYDPHGHSTYSDGFDTPTEIVKAAIGKIDFLAISDHNNVAGIPEFLEAVKKVNDEGYTIKPVPSTEASTSKGHMIMAVCEPSQFDGFYKWASTIQLHHGDPVRLITHSVLEFGAHCIFTHPEIPGANGFKLEDIAQTLDQLPIELINSLAIETYNGTASIMPVIASLVRRRVRQWNKQYKLAEVAGTDFHTKYLAGSFSNLVPYDQTPTEAIRNRSITVSRRDTTPKDVLLTVISHGSPLLKYKAGFDPTPYSRKILKLIGD